MALTSRLTEGAFVSSRQGAWGELAHLSQRAADVGLRRLAPADLARLSPGYRDACADLAHARAARYSAPLVEQLELLAAQAHSTLYAARRGQAARVREAFAAFPRAVRRRKGAVALAALLFFAPLAFGLLASLSDPTFAFKVAPEAMLRQLSEAYARGFDEGRRGGEGALMAGFYVNNNVGIALRCFATGIFGGLGSAFYLFQNGLSIGAILGYVISQGAGANIGVFIIGHGSFELGAIVLAGGAGLSMGWSIVSPGEKTRLHSLQDTSKDVVVIVAGAAAMLLVAALLEGFWSGSSLPAEVKLVFGGAMFALVSAYLVLAGRARAEGAP